MNLISFVIRIHGSLVIGRTVNVMRFDYADGCCYCCLSAIDYFAGEMVIVDSGSGLNSCDDALEIECFGVSTYLFLTAFTHFTMFIKG